jgi:YHS domain-containing protein
MFRFFGILLVFILVVPLIRGIMRIVLRGFADLFKPAAVEPQRQSQRREVPVAGELKKDPVCGTYISTATPFKKTYGGRTVYFCSQGCQERYKA